MTRKRKPRGLDLHTKGPQPGRQRTPHAYAHLGAPKPYTPPTRPADWWSPEAKEVFKEELAKGTDPDEAWNLALKKHMKVLSEANPNLKAKLLRYV